MKWQKFIPLLVVAAGILAYHNSITAPFIFDDLHSIAGNPTIRHLWPVWSALSPPPSGGVGGRPMINLSLAVNYALGGFDVRGYHATNLAIHIFAGLALFGIVRRTLRQPNMSGRFGAAAEPLALATVLIWVVHPLQTESVTCVIQRSESLMGLLYLLTLYWFIRGATSLAPSGWYTLSVAACLLGMASKEVMVSAPLMALLYDRTFVSGSFREAWSRRWRVYLALASTWILLGYLVAVTGTEGGQRGFGTSVAWWEYALTQFRVIVRYLYLSVWPHPLVLDYGAGLARHVAEVVPHAILILLLLVGTAIALWRRPAIGFVGAWFFAILAPSSSIVPLITQTVAEHRMYLPLAAVDSLVIVGVFMLGRYLLGRRQTLLRVVGWGLGCALVFLLAILTIRRNSEYCSELRIWQDTVNEYPNNPRAQLNLGLALFQASRIREGIERFEEAVRLKPDYAEAHNDLGNALLEVGRVQDAIVHFKQALRLTPKNSFTHNNLANALLAAGKPEEAMKEHEEAVRLEPNNPHTQRILGNALLDSGKPQDAISPLERATQLKPDWADAHNDLGCALLKVRRIQDAIEHFQEAVRLRPDWAEAHNNLGYARLTSGDVQEAIRELEEAVRLKPDYVDAHRNLGAALMDAGRTQEAVKRLEQAERLRRK